MTTTPAPAPVVLRIPPELADDARRLVASLAAVIGTNEADVLDVLHTRVDELGTVEALREFVAALTITYAECLALVPLDQSSPATNA